MKTLRLPFLSLIVAIALYGCMGKDGAPGAQGPQGATGNANVVSDTFTVRPSYWVASGNSLVASFTASQISITAYNSGAVELYYQAVGTLTWTALPWTYPLDTTGISQSLTYSYDNTQGLYLQLDNSNGRLPAVPSANFSCKLVVIPPAVMKAHPNANWKDYAVTKQILNLRD